MTKINKIPLIFLFIFVFGCISAVNAENPLQVTNTCSTDPIITDPTLLYSGTLTVVVNPTTAHVNDTVQFIVTVTNTGLVDWSSLKIYIPIPKGLQFVSFVVPDEILQNYDPSTGIYDLYRMQHYGRGQQKTAILTLKVLPEAAGKTLDITARFQQMVLEGYGIDMASKVQSARSNSLVIMNNGNTSNSGSQNGTGIHLAPTAKANTPSGFYKTKFLVKLSMNESGNIYYTTNGKTPFNTSQKYTRPININSTTELKFIAIDKFLSKSQVYTKIYVIDRIPPKLISASPENSQTHFSLTTPINVVFNEKIFKGLQYSNIQIKNKNTNKTVSITKSISGNKLTIKMVRSRLSLNSYQVYIPTGAVKDRAGNKNSKYISTFKTSKY